MIHRCGRCTGELDSAGVCHWCKTGRRPPPPRAEDEHEIEPPDSMEGAIENLRGSWRELVLVVGEAPGLEKLLDRLEAWLGR